MRHPRRSRFESAATVVAAAAAAALFAAPAGAQVVFSDGYNTNNAASYDVFTSNPNTDASATFGENYGSLVYQVDDGLGGISLVPVPEAPNSSGGTATSGLVMRINDVGGQVNSMSAFPKNQSFSGNYKLTYDMFISYNGPALGGTASTEWMLAGINQNSNGNNVAGPTILTGPPAIGGQNQGYSFAVTGEGGSGTDYRTYIDQTNQAARGFAATGATPQNHTDPYYQALFPNPPFETAGAPGKQWVEVELSQIDGVITWKMNDAIISSYADTTYASGNITLGYMDVNATSVPAGQAQYQFIVYDNVVVESLGGPVARTLFWDINGTTAGAGGAAPGGDWNGTAANFNTDAAGAGAGPLVALTTALDDVVFAAGTDGGGTYTVNVSGTQAANKVTVARGNVTLAGGTLATGSVEVATGATASVSSALTPSAGLTKSGPGTLSLTASNTYTGTTTVTAGTLQVNPAAAAPLLTGPGGTDITGGRVQFDGGDPAAIRSLLVTSYNGGTNRFQNGQIRSTGIPNNRALGYRDNGTNVTVMYTVNGDANLSGDVTIADLNVAKANFGGAPDVWATGDFNYDGTTTIGDINTAKANFGQSLPLVAGGSSSRSAALQADGNAGPDSIELIVNVITGQCQMVGNDADPGEITSYEVRSLTGSLNAAGYTSLADQGRAGWGELPGTDFLVGEDHGFTADAVNATGFSLGNLFRPGQTQNLQFNYGDEQFNTIAGVVTYVPEPTAVTLLGLGAVGLLARRRR